MAGNKTKLLVCVIVVASHPGSPPDQQKEEESLVHMHMNNIRVDTILLDRGGRAIQTAIVFGSYVH